MTSEALIKLINSVRTNDITNTDDNVLSLNPIAAYQDLIGAGFKVTKKDWEEVLEKEATKFKDDLHMEIKKGLNPELVNTNYEYLYTTDDLVSNKITWNDTRVKVKFYDWIDNLHIPWWKFWVSKVNIANKKNVELWHEACAVAKAKNLLPPPPPCTIRVKYA